MIIFEITQPKVSYINHLKINALQHWMLKKKHMSLIRLAILLLSILIAFLVFLLLFSDFGFYYVFYSILWNQPENIYLLFNKIV